MDKNVLFHGRGNQLEIGSSAACVLASVIFYFTCLHCGDYNPGLRCKNGWKCIQSMIKKLRWWCSFKPQKNHNPLKKYVQKKHTPLLLLTQGGPRRTNVAVGYESTFSYCGQSRAGAIVEIKTNRRTISATVQLSLKESQN